ncbi:MAG: iron-sulfur cluster assembly scaffold protein [Desulfotalea sp.]
MAFSAIIMAFVVLLLVVACWFSFHYLANTSLKNPDAKARITGNCGDTMEIEFSFVNGKVGPLQYLSDGCGISKKCLEGVAMLARGKSIVELEKINMMDIMDLTGHLPDTHVHCAQLAETTLQHALKNYRINKQES